MVEKQEKSRGERLAERFIQAGKNAKQREANMVLVRKALAEEKLYSKPEKKEVQRYFKNYKKQSQGRQAIKDIRYKKSPSGRLVASFRAIQKPTATLYRRNMTLAQQKALENNFKAMQKSRQQQPRFIPIRQPIQTPQQQEFDFCFRNGDLITPQLEKEVFNNANGGVSADGDKMAFQLGREVGFNSSFMIPSPLMNIEREVKAHSRLSHINPIKNMNAEVDFFSRLLD